MNTELNSKNKETSVKHRTKSHVSVFLKRGGNMQLHVSVMFNMHKKWSGSVVYAATETRENVTKPSCFQNGLTCFCHVSVYGFLQFRPVKLCVFT